VRVLRAIAALHELSILGIEIAFHPRQQENLSRFFYLSKKANRPQGRDIKLPAWILDIGDQAAELPGKGATSRQAPFCAGASAWEDVVEEVFFHGWFVAACLYLPDFFGGAGCAICR
jgi:hypothetical protein